MFSQISRAVVRDCPGEEAAKTTIDKGLNVKTNTILGIKREKTTIF